jgi:hypothetical protein
MRPPSSNTVNHKHIRRRSDIRALATKVALAACKSFVPASAALGADTASLDTWRTLLPPHAGWTLLAGIGLVAVAVAAFTVTRAKRDAPAHDVPPAPRVHASFEPPVLDTPAADASAADATSTPDPLEQEPAVEATFLPPTVIVEPVDAPELPSFELEVKTAQPAIPASGSQLFLALHHVDVSIDVLHRHLQRDTRPMPAVWLMLLDLCRTHGREQAFRDIALEFHRRFNARTPIWDGFPPDRDDPGLEAYPRLVKEITLAWGTHDCRRLLDRLLYDNRGGDRRGFTLNAYHDLIALRRAAEAVLETIDQDLAEEAKVRSAFASAKAEIGDVAAEGASTPKSPLVRDLEAQLEEDLSTDAGPQSAIERDYPALARMLAREWGNAGMSARLCEMLARGGDTTRPLSTEATAELELLRTIADRLHAANA